MYKMWDLTEELEMTLGPESGDLAMRMGIHSGPVTAGILRGERARFQLFGDTVVRHSCTHKTLRLPLSLWTNSFCFLKEYGLTHRKYGQAKLYTRIL